MVLMGSVPLTVRNGALKGLEQQPPQLCVTSMCAELQRRAPHGDDDLLICHLPIAVQIQRSKCTADGGLLGGHVALELCEVHLPISIAVVLPHDLGHVGVAIRQPERTESRLRAGAMAAPVGTVGPQGQR